MGEDSWQVLYVKKDPPQDEVLVANASGVADWNKVLVGALRGGGWNVKTFIDQPAKTQSAILGDTAAGHALALIFTGAKHLPSKQTTLLLGSDLAPQKD